MTEPSTDDGLSDEPLTVTPCEGGYIVEGPRAVMVAMTSGALRESARHLTEALDKAAEASSPHDRN